MSLAATAGLSLDQAPPLHVPGRFFLTAPLAAIAAGVLLLVQGSAALTSPWAPSTIALTHLGTLGFLATIMWGALYQMLPVVGGRPVPALRLAMVAHALHVLGVVGLEAGLLGVGQRAAQLGLASLSAALLCSMLPVGWAIATAPAKTTTLRGMGVALASLGGGATLGVVLGLLYAVGWVQPARPALLQVHLALGLLGWVGVLLASVSLTIAPMFYLSPPVPDAQARGGLWVAGASMAAAALSALVGHPLPLLALPAAVVLWIAHPAALLHSFTLRRRKVREPSLEFWRVGLATAALVAGLAFCTELDLHPRLGLLTGWVAIVGWAGVIAHGMLYRIVPFLVWFHRFSPRVGLEPVPSLRELLVARRQYVALGLHCAATTVGAAAIVGANDALARLAGALLVAAGLALLLNLAHTLRRA